MKVKKIIVMMVIALLLIATMSGCNRTLIDTTYKFTHAIIALPNGDVVEGEVTSWKDFEDGDQLQITIDGITYLTHASNIVLIKK